MEDKAIYVVLIKAHTKLGGVARKITKYPYTHIALCFDSRLEEFVTFSRKQHNFPFDAGFMRETRACYTFGKYKTVQTKIFKVPVSPKEEKRILAFVQMVEQDEEYLFNLFSMMTMPLIHGFRIFKTYNCMSFVSKALSLTKAVSMEKPYYKNNIQDIDELLTPYFAAERILRTREKVSDEYMRKISPKTNFVKGIGLVNDLVKRMFKGKFMEEHTKVK